MPYMPYKETREERFYNDWEDFKRHVTSQLSIIEARVDRLLQPRERLIESFGKREAELLQKIEDLEDQLRRATDAD